MRPATEAVEEVEAAWEEPEEEAPPGFVGAGASPSVGAPRGSQRGSQRSSGDSVGARVRSRSASARACGARGGSQQGEAAPGEVAGGAAGAAAAARFALLAQREVEARKTLLRQGIARVDLRLVVNASRKQDAWAKKVRADLQREKAGYEAELADLV